MPWMPQGKSVIVLTSAGITNGATASANIDCIGFDFLTLDVFGSTVAATSNKPSVLKISESDTTNATDFADVTALVGGGTGGFTIPNWATNTTTNKTVKFNVDLRTRKRYLKLTISPLTTQDLYAFGNLFMAEIAPVNTTDTNTLALVSA